MVKKIIIIMMILLSFGFVYSYTYNNISIVNPISYWSLDSSNISGLNVIDTINNNNFINHGASSNSLGFINEDLDFISSESDYLITNYISQLELDNFTISMWIKPDDFSETQRIFGLQLDALSGQRSGLMVGITTLGQVQYAGVSSSSFEIKTTTNTLQLGEYYFISIRKLGTNLTININETSESFIISESIDYLNNGKTILGARIDNGVISQPFNGKIDEVVVYDYFLNDTEIEAQIIHQEAGYRLDSSEYENISTLTSKIILINQSQSNNNINIGESNILFTKIISNKEINKVWISTNESSNFINYSEVFQNNGKYESGSEGYERIITNNGIAYVNSRYSGDGAIHSINITNGALIRTYGSGLSYMGGMLIYDGILAGYTGGASGSVTTINLWNISDGTLINSSSLSTGSSVHLIADYNDKIVYGSSSKVCKANKHDLSNEVCTSSYNLDTTFIFDKTNDIVFIPTTSYNIIAFNMSSMTEVDSISTGCGDFSSEQAIIGGQTFNELYVSCKEQYVKKYSFNNGELNLEWSKLVNLNYNFANGLFYNQNNSLVLVGDRDEPLLYALNISSGDIVWTHNSSLETGSPNCANLWSGGVSFGDYITYSTNIPPSCNLTTDFSSFVVLNGTGDLIYNHSLLEPLGSSANSVIDGGYLIVPCLDSSRGNKVEIYNVGYGKFINVTHIKQNAKMNSEGDINQLFPLLNIYNSPNLNNMNNTYYNFTWQNNNYIGDLSWRIYAEDISGIINYTDIKTFSVTLLQSCESNWMCNGYGLCQEDNREYCNSVVDLNTCGESYTGNYSEFLPDICVYSEGGYSSSYTAEDIPKATVEGVVTFIAFITAFVGVVVTFIMMIVFFVIIPNKIGFNKK